MRAGSSPAVGPVGAAPGAVIRRLGRMPYRRQTSQDPPESRAHARPWTRRCGSSAGTVADIAGRRTSKWVSVAPATSAFASGSSVREAGSQRRHPLSRRKAWQPRGYKGAEPPSALSQPPVPGAVDGLAPGPGPSRGALGDGPVLPRPAPSRYGSQLRNFDLGFRDRRQSNGDQTRWS